MKYYCPQCGNFCDEFVEGYCATCFEENQQLLGRFYAEYDHWKKLSDKEKDSAIKRRYYAN